MGMLSKGQRNAPLWMRKRCLTNEAGREWSRRAPSDIDEARKGELSGESESIEPG
jgi:hypothetical protein